MTFAAVWRFEVREERIAEFERHYGRDGSWAQLFRKGRGFIGTELFRSTSENGVYLTIDTWESEDAFHDFKRVHAVDYEALDRECESMTVREHRVT